MFAKFNSKSLSIALTAAFMALGISSTALAGDAATALRNVADAADRPEKALATQPAMACSECKVSTFQRVVSLKGTFARVETVQRMDCPQCHSALANLFRIGKFKHTCDLAVASVEHCEH